MRTTMLTMMSFTALAASLGGCIASPADSDSPPNSDGELGRVHFKYDSGNGLGVSGDYHPALDRAIMVGSTETIGLEDGGWLRIPALKAMSSNPDIVAIVGERTQCECGGTPLAECTAATTCEYDDLYRVYQVLVQGRGAGTVELSLLDPNGQLYDQTKLSANVPASIELEEQFRTDDCGGVEARTVTSIDLDLYGSSGNNGGFDSEAPIWLRARDTSGKFLVASTGVETMVSDKSVVESAFVSDDTSQSSLELVPKAQGQAMLVMSVSAAGSQRMAIQVPVHVH